MGVKMWKRKDLTKKDGGVTYEAELMARMEEQFREGKRKSDPNAENDDDNDDEKEEGEETENKNNENFVKSSGENEENEDKENSNNSSEKEKSSSSSHNKTKSENEKLSLDEIEEIRKKRERFKEKQQKKSSSSTSNRDKTPETIIEKREKSKITIKIKGVVEENSSSSSSKNKDKDKKSEEKEEGEVNSEDERKEKNRKEKSSSSRSVRKVRSRSRSRDRTSRRSRSRSREYERRISFKDRDNSYRDSRSSRDKYSGSSRSYRSRSRSNDRYNSSRSRRSRSRSRSRDRSRGGGYFTSFRSSRDGHGYRERDRERDRDRYSRSYKRRSRSRSRENSFRGSRKEIDKAKLLAIAKKNAVKILSSDNLMGMDHDRLIAIKSGGQSLRQLTDFCREIAAKGITDEFDDDDDLLYGNEDFHHPFEVKDKALPNPYQSAGISSEIHITPAMKNAVMGHRMIEFPVSSGNAHRVKEVDVKEELKPDDLKPDKLAIENKSEEKSEGGDDDDENKEAESPKPTEAQKFNEANPLAVMMFGGMPEAPKAIELAAPAVLPSTSVSADESSLENSANTKPDKVFEPAPEPSKDISSIVSQRLNAMKKLSDNPNDSAALKDLYDAQKEMSNWATSKNKPGQFTGHTGAKILTHAELTSGLQAWAKQDQFTKAQKVSGGFGEFMLKKMGWSQGEGLGKTRSGDIDPLTLDIKMDKKGLMAAEEDLKKRKRGGGGGEDVGPITMTGCKDLSHKHPVSALMELATRRKWGPPNFVQLFECGPSHKKQYIFKVTVNGQEFQPSIASENKKKAKCDAATVCLQKMGLLMVDPNNPL